MKTWLAFLAFLLLSGCSSWNHTAVPQNLGYILDGTSSGHLSGRAKVTRSIRSSSSYASIEATGTVPNVDEKADRELFSKLAKLKAETPEWLAIREKIDKNIAVRTDVDQSQLVICRGC